MEPPNQMKAFMKEVFNKLPLKGQTPDNVTLKCNVLVADNEGVLKNVGLTLNAYADNIDNFILMSTDGYPGGDVDDKLIILNGDQSVFPHQRYKKLFQQFNEGGEFGVEEALLKKKGNGEGSEGVIGNIEFSFDCTIREEDEEEEEEEEDEEEEEEEEEEEDYEGGGADYSPGDEDYDMKDGDEGAGFNPNYDPNGPPYFSQIQCTPDGYTFTHKK